MPIWMTYFGVVTGKLRVSRKSAVFQYLQIYIENMALHVSDNLCQLRFLFS